MQVFVFLNDIEKAVDDYKKYKKKALEEVDSCYEILLNVDSVWIDNNSRQFLSTIREERIKLEKYFLFLDKFYDLVDAFRNDLKSLMSNYNFYDVNKIDYSSDRIQECINCICDAAWYISDALDNMNEIVYPSDFCELPLVDYILNHFYWYRDDLNNYADNICNFSNTLNQVVRENQSRRYSLGSFDEKFKKMNYSWKNVYLNESISIDTKDVESNLSNFKSRSQESVSSDVIGDLSANTKNEQATEIETTSESTINNIGDLGANTKNEQATEVETIGENTINNIGDLGANTKNEQATEVETTSESTINNIGDLDANTKNEQAEKKSSELILESNIDLSNLEDSKISSSNRTSKIDTGIQLLDTGDFSTTSVSNTYPSISSDSIKLENVDSTSATMNISEVSSERAAIDNVTSVEAIARPSTVDSSNLDVSEVTNVTSDEISPNVQVIDKTKLNTSSVDNFSKTNFEN